VETQINTKLLGEKRKTSLAKPVTAQLTEKERRRRRRRRRTSSEKEERLL
jgi:hypothetical protein